MTVIEKVEGKILTGVGEGYLQRMKTEDISSTGVTYEDKTLEVGSIDKISFKADSKSKPIYLSNKKVTDLGKFSSAELTVDYGWFPEGFVEEMSGMKKLADGVYVQGDTPILKYFRWSFSVTDQDGGEIIYNFPKCQIEIPDFNAETETDEKKENYQQVTIKAYPLLGVKNNPVYSKMDLRVNKQYDRTKLLTQGFYDAETLKACLKEGATDSSVVPSV